ncbi:dienelactone hydrolase family protein [Gulosibacter faecalis]|uniref:Dienelactone hydrolase family protein n=1 Tax=Gulosibacter faecalis TaxID=272240 RepID=A0ABW5V1C8_9MICO|nr:dienelactone hydrolase family protein [Gulosibacter faecalis]
MTQLVRRDVDYRHAGTTMSGLLIAPAGASNLPAVVLIHDAFGLGGQMIATAERLAAIGLAVFAADVWGGRRVPAGEDEVGELLGSIRADRNDWLGRIAAAHDAARAQPEVDGAKLVNMGYCFGGSSALEHLRLHGDVIGTIAVHPGLDLLDFDWPERDARVLVLAGASDPMASAEDRARLDTALTGVGVDWELDLYGATKHGFTSEGLRGAPENPVVGFHERNAARAWRRGIDFLTELFPQLDTLD